MKKIVSLLLALSVLVACASVLVSCGAPKDAGPEIKVYLGEEIYDFDPTDYYVDSNAEQVMSLLFEPLFTLNANGKLQYAAANKYSVDKKERKITIELRESYWSDEQRVTANDYIFAWRDVLLEPNNANPAAALLFDIENAKEVKSGECSLYDFGAIATDTYEITITYREGADYEVLLKNLASVATSPLRQDIVIPQRAGYWTKVLNYTVTNGPFRISTINYDSGAFTLTRNGGYHQGTREKNYTKNVTPNQLISFTNTDGNTVSLTYNDIVNKTVFYMGDATLADRAANKKNATVVDDLSTYTYVFNMDNDLFKIKEVRQALSMAINRDAIIAAITFGKAATGFLPDSVINSSNGKSFRKNAQTLITVAGNLSGAQALLATVDFTGIDKSFTLHVADNEEDLKIAELVAATWTQLGFEVEVKAVDAKTTTITDFGTEEKITIKDSAIQALVKQATHGDRNFDVIAVDWQMYSTDAFAALAAFATEYSGCGVDFANGNAAIGSFGGFSDPAYDALIDKAYNATDAKARYNALKEAEAYLVDSACIVPLVYNQSFAFVSKDLSGVATNALGNFVFSKVKQKNYEDYLN